MYRWLLVLLLTMASAIAWAQSVPPANITGKAQEVAGVAERRVTQLATKRQAVAARYEGELSAIDRLKQKKKTWNSERELKEKLSAANETATQLRDLDRSLTAARSQLAGSKRVLIAAIDAELTAKPVPARVQVLQRLRASLVPQMKLPSAHRIAIPNFEIDPNADPEDLDAQAAELRQIEAELMRQVTSLDKQSKDLERTAELRRSHDRTIALDRRDDNTPTRNTPPGGNNGVRGLGEASDSPAPSQEDGTGGTSPPPADMGFETEATVVLQDVVDPSTIDTLTSAQRSGDPSKRSKAAAKTRDAVKVKLDQLRAKRSLIEQRAKQLRK
ncbi:MAG: hypothetical protein M4D80_39700 [Myxococcota bacterium]|nr:hypothetical protein [Myxococcota bacterium]